MSSSHFPARDTPAYAHKAASACAAPAKAAESAALPQSRKPRSWLPLCAPMSWETTKENCQPLRQGRQLDESDELPAQDAQALETERK